MPLLCYGSSSSRKRSNKRRVGSVAERRTNNERERNTSINHLTNGRYEHPTSATAEEGGPVLAIVLQNYSSTAPDKLTVQRSQVVEVASSDGDWVYARTMDGGGGYVPKSHCLNFNLMNGDFNFNNMPSSSPSAAMAGVSLSGPTSRPRSINVDTLQRSGSSVNSVEVHQVINTPSGGVVPSSDGPRTLREVSAAPSSSSQVIYEVPKSPENRRHSLLPPSASSVNNEGGGGGGGGGEMSPSGTGRVPPMLPPRSAYLQSPVDIQRGVQHHTHLPPSSLQLLQPSNSSQQQQNNHRPEIGISRFSLAPHATSRSTMFSPQTPGSLHHHPFPGSQPVASASTPGGSSAHHVMAGTPGGYNASNTPGGSSAQYHHHHPITYTPGAASPPKYPPGGSHHLLHHHHHQHNHPSFTHMPPFLSGFMNSQTSSQGNNTSQLSSGSTADFSLPFTAHTPGSAGVPAHAASPTSARIAQTPGSPSSIFPGCTSTTPKLAATPGAVGGGRGGGGGGGGSITSPLWFEAASSNSTPPLNGQRVPPRLRRYRRYSSDIVLVDSTITENETSGIHHPQDSHRLQTRRRSQPCINVHAINHTPTNPGPDSSPHRPTQLAVRRSLSMHENSGLHRINPGTTGSARTPGAIGSARTPGAIGSSRTPGAIGSACTPGATGSARTLGGIRARTSHVPIHRALSYKEAVLTEDERRFGVAAGIKPSELITSSTPTGLPPPPQGQSSKVKSGPTDSTSASDCEPLEIDDVFLPDENKPMGIYRSVRDHAPKFKGEIALRAEELVIVLDYGRGEWAWVITSSNIEGLIPKSALVRYKHQPATAEISRGSGAVPPSSTRVQSGGVDTATGGVGGTAVATSMRVQSGGVDAATGGVGGTAVVTSMIMQSGGVDATTQTDVMEVFRCKDSSTSCTASALASAESNASSPSSTMPLRNRRKKKTGFVPPEITSSSDQPKAPKDSRPPKEWFDTLDSVDFQENEALASKKKTNSLSTSSHTSSILSSPTACPTSPPGKSSKVIAPPEGSIAHKYTKVVMRKKKAISLPYSVSSSPPSSSGPVRRVTSVSVHYHDRISGMGSMSYEGEHNADSPSSKAKNLLLGTKPSTILTAIKDYSPPSSTKNCLPLKKGDTLHSQPHMHYPKGWMWVWHTGRRSFGYVPKSYVAYTYDTPPRERRNTLEDAV